MKVAPRVNAYQCGVTFCPHLLGFTIVRDPNAQTGVAFVDDVAVDGSTIHIESLRRWVILNRISSDSGEVPRGVVEQVVVGFGHFCTCDGEAIALGLIIEFYLTGVFIAGDTLKDTPLKVATMRSDDVHPAGAGDRFDSATIFGFFNYQLFAIKIDAGGFVCGARDMANRTCAALIIFENQA